MYEHVAINLNFKGYVLRLFKVGSEHLKNKISLVVEPPTTENSKQHGIFFNP